MRRYWGSPSTPRARCEPLESPRITTPNATPSTLLGAAGRVLDLVHNVLAGLAVLQDLAGVRAAVGLVLDTQESRAAWPWGVGKRT